MTTIAPQLRVRATIILMVAATVMYYPLGKYLYRYVALGVDSGFLRELGFFSGPPGTWWAWLLAPVVGVGYAVFTALKVGTIRQHWREISWFNAVSLYVALPAAIVEEAFFRRWLMDGMFGHLVWPAQLLLSGVLFGVAHGVWGLLKGSVRIAWEATKATTGLGLLLAALYLLSDRSLAPVITAHFLLTALIEPWLIVGVMQRPEEDPVE